MLVLVHVDDLGLVADCPHQLDTFKRDMGREFNMKELGETRYYTGYPFHTSSRAQNGTPPPGQIHPAASRTVSHAGCQNSHDTHGREPYPHPGRRSRTRELEEMAGVPYAKLVGSLNFLSSCTGLTLAAQSLSCPDLWQKGKPEGSTGRQLKGYSGTSRAQLRMG